MNIRLRGKTWYADFRLPDGERVRDSLGTDSETEARRLVADLYQKRMLAHERKTPTSGMGFKEAFDKAMEEYEPWRASTSKGTIQDNFKHLAKELGEDRALVTLNREVMIELAAKWRKAGKSASTINQRLSLVSVVLKEAEVWTNGAVRPFKMPRQKVSEGRIRILSREEEDKVCKWFQEHGHPLMADLTVVLADTGFRLSEALKLEPSSIQWEAGRVAAWETKSGKPRLIPMTVEVQKTLRRLLSEKPKAGPFSGLTRDRAEKLWAAMRYGIGINLKTDPEFVLHALRHTCASRLAASGMDSFRIQKWMGHSQIKTTMIYVTLFAPDLDALADALTAGRDVSKAVPESVPSGVTAGCDQSLEAV